MHGMSRNNKFVLVFLTVAMLSLALVVSCSFVQSERIVKVTIPQHPWETVGDKTPLWYILKWTCGSELKSLYVSQNEREFLVSVPAGQTVYFCAYPLGEMSPFGGAVTPTDRNNDIVLTQNEGIVVDLLINGDRSSSSKVNYRKLVSYMHEKSDDFRLFDQVRLIRDVHNGDLKESSIKNKNYWIVPQIAIPNGLWMSEFVRDSSMVVENGLSKELELPEGVFRYYNSSIDRELVVIVDEEGNSFSYIRQALV